MTARAGLKEGESERNSNKKAQRQTGGTKTRKIKGRKGKMEKKKVLISKNNKGSERERERIIQSVTLLPQWAGW